MGRARARPPAAETENEQDAKRRRKLHVIKLLGLGARIRTQRPQVKRPLAILSRSPEPPNSSPTTMAQVAVASSSRLPLDASLNVHTSPAPAAPCGEYALAQLYGDQVCLVQRTFIVKTPLNIALHCIQSTRHCLPLMPSPSLTPPSTDMNSSIYSDTHMPSHCIPPKCAYSSYLGQRVSHETMPRGRFSSRATSWRASER